MAEKVPTSSDTSMQSLLFKNLKEGNKMKFQTKKATVKKGEVVSLDFSTPLDFGRVRGFLIDATDKKALDNSSIYLEIDANEIFPKGFGCGFISRKESQGFYDNVHIINERANNSNVKIEYTDAGKGDLEEYEIIIYLWCTYTK